MRVILIPGLWLDASSWDAVVPALEASGHTALPLTMPGTGIPAPAADSVGLAEWIAAVVAEIDAEPGPAVLVGHSGGGNVAWGAADARPERVARVVFVDTAPPPDGADISEFPVVEGVVPFPGWDVFDEPDIADLDEQTRARVAEAARSVPGRVPTDPVTLHDDRRHAIPVTILSGQLGEEQFRAMLAEWPRFAAEFGAIADVEVVRLGTGHWPQFSAPEVLVRALVTALR
jgi:pimeloyl-ACP methyl ester carboxylesterase